MINLAAGPEGVFQPGQIVTGSLAEQFIAGGAAVELKGPPAPEAATIAPPETAARPKPKARRGR